jgi:hypothetical protein
LTFKNTFICVNLRQAGGDVIPFFSNLYFGHEEFDKADPGCTHYKVVTTWTARVHMYLVGLCDPWFYDKTILCLSHKRFNIKSSEGGRGEITLQVLTTLNEFFEKLTLQ